MAFIFIQQAGDGLVQGDRYRVDVDCGPGPASTSQRRRRRMSSSPGRTSPHSWSTSTPGTMHSSSTYPTRSCRCGSRLFQRVELTAAASSTVIVGETLQPGRVAHGETHAYDLYWSELEACRPDGTQLCADVLPLGALAGASPRSIGLLDGHEVLSTLRVLTRQLPARELVVFLREALMDQPGRLQTPASCPTDAAPR